MVGRSSFFLGIRKGRASFLFFGRDQLDLKGRLKEVGRSLLIPSFYTMDQVHGNRVQWIRDAKDGINEVKECDGLVTTEEGVGLCVLTADCVPLLFSSLNSPLKGVLHCGWRGLEKGIINRLFVLLELEGFNHPEELFFVIGPSICGNCYEVGREFERYSLSRFLERKGGKLHLSLQKVIKERLSERGVLEENIKLIPFCTYENADLFYSYRKGDKERQVSLVVS